MTQTTATKIHRPLHELKYAYESRSKATTVQAAISTEFPIIKRKSRQRNEHATKTVLYTDTIKEILKMKLECGYIHDQISLVDLNMKEEDAKYKEATLKHERFTKAFHKFLSHQYDHVKALLTELAEHEKNSVHKKNKLEQLQQKAIEKSLKIYDLERQWRKYKSSQNFLLHLASLLKHELSGQEYRTFGIDPPCDTPSLDDLVRNFEQHSISDRPFEVDEFKHVTAESVSEYLSALRKQNLKLLDLKLRYQNTKEEVEKEKRIIEREYEDRNAKIASEIKETVNKIDETVKEIELTKMKLDAMTQDEQKSKRLNNELQNRVEKLYERCFGTNWVKGSHLQMMKCVEQHCAILLNKLNTFDPQILKKVTLKSIPREAAKF